MGPGRAEHDGDPLRALYTDDGPGQRCYLAEPDV